MQCRTKYIYCRELPNWYSVEKAIFFGFEKKSKVVSDFVQKFSCGPLPDQHQFYLVYKRF